jgi:hypothetical protein
MDIPLAGIEEAAKVIDPVFLNTPQFVNESLSDVLGHQVVVKVETANPIRCFKGRGAEWLISRLNRGGHVVCASSGNFGQAMAYSGRRRGLVVDVFASADVNSVKRARMESFGARVTAVGRDSAECQEAARNHAAATPGCASFKTGGIRRSPRGRHHRHRIAPVRLNRRDRPPGRGRRPYRWCSNLDQGALATDSRRGGLCQPCALHGAELEGRPPCFHGAFGHDRGGH